MGVPRFIRNSCPVQRRDAIGTISLPTPTTYLFGGYYTAAGHNAKPWPSMVSRTMCPTCINKQEWRNKLQTAPSNPSVSKVETTPKLCLRLRSSAVNRWIIMIKSFLPKRNDESL